jgi:hypothetical protein
MEYVKDFDTAAAGVLLDRIKTGSLYRKRKTSAALENQGGGIGKSRKPKLSNLKTMP